MLRQLRKSKPKDTGGFGLVLLACLNIVIWGSVFYFFIYDRSLPPVVSGNFHEPVSVYIPVAHQGTTFSGRGAASLEEIGVEIFSQSALLINLDTNEVIFEHNPREQLFPASITKLMTVLVALEQGEQTDVTILADFDGLVQAQASMAGFVYGEVRPMSQVLHAALLSSGGDATSSLAHHVAGSYDSFVAMMNETAWRLGMQNTHFMNTTGLHHELHYTTAYDIGLLMSYALTLPAFRNLLMADAYDFFNFLGQHVRMESALSTHLPSPNFSNGQILGAMPGFTTPAGLCLASLATDGVHDYVLLTFGATTDVFGAHFTDALTLYTYFLGEPVEENNENVYDN